MSLILILLIVILLFGSGKLKTLGSDLGSALKSFRRSVQEEKDDDDQEQNSDQTKS